MKTKLLIILLIGLLYKAKAQPTFSKDIAPIIYTKCASCHHPNAIAPFSLTSYEEVFPFRSTIAAATQSRSMPPWPPDYKYTHFSKERALSDAEIALIQTWVNNGVPRGDSLQEPPKPIFSSLSKLPKIDLSVRIPTFTVDDAKDIYQCFVLPVGNATQKFVKGIEVLPGNNKVVHHALIFYDTTSVPRTMDSAYAGPGYRAFGGTGSNASVLIGLWVPGSEPVILPSKMGMRLPRNADIIVQIHYAPNNVGEKDSTTIQLMYDDALLGIREVTVNALLNHATSLTNGPLFIPANQQKTFYSSFNVPIDATLLMVGPHMHLIGTSIKSFGVTPTKDTLKLINIPKWDFHWQGGYQFKKLIKLPRGTVLNGEASYDNTANNPNNPSVPPKNVVLGEGTENEMMLIYFWYTRYQQGDENIVLDSSWNVSAQEVTNAALNQYRVFPNPASSYLNVEPTKDLQKGSVYDLTGKLIKQIIIDDKGEINISDLADGLYFVQLKYADAIVTKRFVVRHE